MLWLQLSLPATLPTTLCLPRNTTINPASSELHRFVQVKFSFFLVHQPALPSWHHAQEDAARAHPRPRWDGFLKEAGGSWQCQQSKTQAYPHVIHLHEGFFQVPLSTGQGTAAPLCSIRVFSICSCYLLMPH